MNRAATKEVVERIITLVKEGHSDASVAKQIGVSQSTVGKYRAEYKIPAGYFPKLPRHGHTNSRTGVRINSPTYNSWRSMRDRCNNPKLKTYLAYGAKGISVCARWNNSFEAFLEDMGLRPAGTSLDRFPNRKGNYEPGNCRWGTAQEQADNRDIVLKTHCLNGHILSADNIYASINKHGSLARGCRTCQKDRDKAKRRSIICERMAIT